MIALNLGGDQLLEVTSKETHDYYEALQELNIRNAPSHVDLFIDLVAMLRKEVDAGAKKSFWFNRRILFDDRHNLDIFYDHKKNRIVGFCFREVVGGKLIIRLLQSFRSGTGTFMIKFYQSFAHNIVAYEVDKKTKGFWKKMHFRSKPNSEDYVWKHQ